MYKGKSPMDAPLAHSTAEESPAYDVLRMAGLLVTEFRKQGMHELDIMPPNTTSSQNIAARAFSCLFPPLAGCILYNTYHIEITVPAGHVQKLVDDQGLYHLAGPGMHNITSFFWKRVGSPVPLRGHIKHGDRTIVVVDQGFVGYASDNGQPVLLPPGIHQWRSQTLDFIKYIDLEDHIIPIGPFTLLTVDEGYSAVTQNNGRQVILPGGQVHFLNHRNWKFEKFMTLKVQTDDLERIQATSADNIAMQVTSTVTWKISDVETAAIMAAETMAQSGKSSDNVGDIVKLRKDVLKQAVASLAAFIGSVNYSDSFHVAAAAQASATTTLGAPVNGTSIHSGENPMFDLARMTSAVENANKVTSTYGIEIMSINIISANPIDSNLTRALASGAVASAEALQAETAARGNAKAAIIDAEARSEAMRIDAETQALATKISSQASADAMLVEARAAAESERVRAEGSKEAADLLASNSVAVELAKMDKSGVMLGNNSKIILATEPAILSNVITRPDKL